MNRDDALVMMIYVLLHVTVLVDPAALQYYHLVKTSSLRAWEVWESAWPANDMSVAVERARSSSGAGVVGVAFGAVECAQFTHGHAR